MIADLETNEALSPRDTKLILRRRKLNISFVFISKSYFEVPKTIRLHATHYLIMKIPNKGEIQEIASNYLSDVDFKDFIKPYKDYTKESQSLFMNDTNFSSDTPLRFRKNLL